MNSKQKEVQHEFHQKFFFNMKSKKKNPGRATKVFFIESQFFFSTKKKNQHEVQKVFFILKSKI
jgi:hypothetical protein